MHKEQVRAYAILRSAFTGGVLFFVAVLAALLVPHLKMKGLRKASACASVFPARSAFVELNGAYSRILGRHLCNGTYRTDNGLMLTGLNRRSVTSQANAAIRFAQWLKRQGARFLYVQAPAKADRGGMLHPSVLTHAGNTMADDFLSRLKLADVESLDLREQLALTPEGVLRQFYRTDHHWNNDAVFTAFGVIAQKLAEMTRADRSAVEEKIAASSWEREVWPDCFWGSRGRRTGRLFSGVDDLIVYTPRFPTQMSLDVPSKKIHRSGSFRKTNMWRAKDIRGTGRLEKDAYSFLYVGGLYPLVRHRNAKAPIQTKVMIIGDSFARPLEAFLSTVVSDLVVVDPRRFPKGDTVAQYVRQLHPDIVLQLTNTGGFFSDFIGRKKCGRPVMFDYGLPTAEAK